MTKLRYTAVHSNVVADAITRIRDAASVIQLAKVRSGRHATPDAQDDVNDAVRAARDLGVTWQPIGEALGIARGNAYQRFRHRP